MLHTGHSGSFLPEKYRTQTKALRYTDKVFRRATGAVFCKRSSSAPLVSCRPWRRARSSCARAARSSTCVLGLGLGLGSGLGLGLELGLGLGLGLDSGQYARSNWGATARGTYGTARGWYAYPVCTGRGALGASRPAPPVRTQRGRLVRVARTYPTYPTEAPRRTCQLRRATGVLDVRETLVEYKK